MTQIDVAAVPTFKALGDPTRQQILSLLGEGPKTIAEISDKFEMTRAGVKKHLVLLERGRLISVEARGRERINSLSPDGFAAVSAWVSFFDRFWDDKLAALKQAAETSKPKKD